VSARETRHLSIDPTLYNIHRSERTYHGSSSARHGRQTRTVISSILHNGQSIHQEFSTKRVESNKGVSVMKVYLRNESGRPDGKSHFAGVMLLRTQVLSSCKSSQRFVLRTERRDWESPPHRRFHNIPHGAVRRSQPRSARDFQPPRMDGYCW
jgi:hypothetical protein